MVKRITISLNDDEFEEWKKIKGKKSWYDFFKELVRVKEESECIPSETLEDALKRFCANLAGLAATCSLCGREEALLRLCSGEDDLDILLRVFVIVTNVMEAKMDEYRAWIIRLLKATIIEVCKGDVKGAKELLEEVCSAR